MSDPLCRTSATGDCDGRAGAAAAQLKAEVRFRSFHEQTYDQVCDYMALVLRHRVDELRRLMARGLRLSPFLEIGAETGANSLALVNGCAAEGFALDLSLHALRAMPRYAARLGLKHLPRRVCADALNLPFVNRAFAFELCWGTLHHFVDPGPAAAELRRTIRPDGALKFDGEPVRRLLSLHLWRTREPSNLGALNRLLLRAGLLPWLADIAGAEPLYAGAQENKFAIEVYKRALACFERIEYGYRPLLAGDRPSVGPLARRLFGLLPPLLADRLPTYIFGGVIHGIARPGDERPAVLVSPNGRSDVARGGDLIVLKRVGHDRLRLALDAPAAHNGLRLSIEGRPVTAQRTNGLIEVELPESAVAAAQMRMAVELADDQSLKALALDGGSAAPLIIPTQPALRPAADALLACPACLKVDQRCAAELCGRHCLAACKAAAISIGPQGARIDRQRCTLCLECVRACAFQAIDRQPLTPALECVNCGERFPVLDGVALLLRPELRRALYPES